MKGLTVLLGSLALAGALAADIAAQARPRNGTNTPPGQTTQTGQPARGTETRQRPDNGNCGEMGQLRQELARLQQELRQLQAALADAKQAGNRARAEQIAHQMRRVQSQIQDVQQKIRRLQQTCKGR